jgi:sRNA-binding protein
MNAPRRPIITLKAKPKPPEPVEPPVTELTVKPAPPAPPISKTKLAKARLREATAWMQEPWPAAFCAPIRPLAVGAGLDILAHPSSDFTADERRAAIRAWTCRWDYQRAIVARRRRVNLDGSDNAIGEVGESRAMQQHASSENRARQRPARDRSIPTLPPPGASALRATGRSRRFRRQASQAKAIMIVALSE